MLTILTVENTTYLVISLVLLGCKVWALVDAITHPSAAFVAADKQSKGLWLVLLSLAALVSVLQIGNPLGLLNLAGTVAAFVYLADARPALRSLRR